MTWSGPILDNHLHLDARTGRGIDAVREFGAAGGSHLLVVNQPSWHHDVEVAEKADFQVGFDATVSIVEQATAVLSGRAWAVLGVHPALISRLVDDRDIAPARAEDIMKRGIEAASEYVRAGEALALKSGRPHYEVSDAVWDASNAVLRHGLEQAARCDCALQLHTEATDDLTDVGGWAARAGVPPECVVKHYADGPMRGAVPSVIARKDALEAASAAGDPFLMETDYLDDPERPGAVLGPKTVPRRVAWLAEQGETEALETAHIHTPQRVYGIDPTETHSP